MEFVAYYRVKDLKDPALAGQKRAVKAHLKGCPPQADFTETERENPARPELNRALDYCKHRGATLLVAKLDLLSRDLGFISRLKASGIDFICCDMLQVTRKTIGFMVALVEWERAQTARRTKEALAEKRRKGGLLGANNPKVRAGLMEWRKKKVFERVNKVKEKAGKKAKEPKSRRPTKREQADKQVLQSIKTLLKAGYSYQKIAYAFNLSRTPTRQRKRWSPVQVFRVAKRNNLK